MNLRRFLFAAFAVFCTLPLFAQSANPYDENTGVVTDGAASLRHLSPTAPQSDRSNARYLTDLVKTLRANKIRLGASERTASAKELIRAFDLCLLDALARVPRSSDEVARAFAAYKAGSNDGIPVRRQVDDTGMLGRWEASHDIYAVSMAFTQGMKRLDVPDQTVAKACKKATRDLIFSVWDPGNPDLKNFTQAARKLELRLESARSSLASAMAALEGRK